MQTQPTDRLPDELKSLKESFTHWRLSKNGKTEQTPPRLWEQLRALMPKYPVNVLISIAGVTKDAAIRYFALSGQYQLRVDQQAIVEIPNPMQLSAEQKRSFQLLIQHARGHQLSVTLDKEMACSAIRSFMA